MHEAYKDDFERVRDTLPGRSAPWLQQMREAALERFMALGFPTPRQEAWKYTDVRPIEKRRFALAERAQVDTRVLTPHLLGEERGHRIVFVNGRFSSELSYLGQLPKGVTVRSFAEALESEPSVLEAFLGKYADATDNGFTAMNTAFMNDGVFIRIGRDVALAEPVQVLYLSTGAQDCVAHLRNLIVADANSRATVVESYIALGDEQYLTNAVSEIVVDQGAAVEHYKLQQESTRAYHISEIVAHQLGDSDYTSHNVSLGGRLVRNELKVLLDDPGAACTLNGLYMGAGRQHLDNHTQIDHLKPHCTSHEWYKGVLDGHARGIFSGRVVVHPDAQKSDAQQANNNLLLSRDAEADSKPQLEIYADDVKASHGSTVGQLNTDSLFYLRSRALDEDLARSILVYAFASDILNKMKLVPLRSRLEGEVAKHLLGGQTLEEAL